MHAAQQKFASNASEDRVAELEGLQQFLNEGIAAVDAAAKEMAAPADRIRELLSSKDKKAALLDLASTSFTPLGDATGHLLVIYWGSLLQRWSQGIVHKQEPEHTMPYKCLPLCQM